MKTRVLTGLLFTLLFATAFVSAEEPLILSEDSCPLAQASVDPLALELGEQPFEAACNTCFQAYVECRDFCGFVPLQFICDPAHPCEYTCVCQ